LNGTHLLSYADDVNLLGDNIETMKKNTETIIDASKEIGVEVNVEKTKHMLVPQCQNAGQNCHIKMENKLSENLSQLKYFGKTVRNQNFFQKEIKRRLYSFNA
jgi:hypothetical protein